MQRLQTSNRKQDKGVPLLYGRAAREGQILAIAFLLLVLTSSASAFLVETVTPFNSSGFAEFKFQRNDTGGYSALVVVPVPGASVRMNGQPCVQSNQTYNCAGGLHGVGWTYAQFQLTVPNSTVAALQTVSVQFFTTPEILPGIPVKNNTVVPVKLNTTIMLNNSNQTAQNAPGANPVCICPAPPPTPACPPTQPIPACPGPPVPPQPEHIVVHDESGLSVVEPEPEPVPVKPDIFGVLWGYAPLFSLLGSTVLIVGGIIYMIKKSDKGGSNPYDAT